MDIKQWFQLWFSLSEPVGPRVYALSGFSLTALKILVESGLVYGLTGEVWGPWELLRPRSFNDWPFQGESSRLALILLFFWSLPFAWIGASMTLRRGLDAGLGRVGALGFFIPGVNYLYMLALCMLKSAPDVGQSRDSYIGQIKQTNELSSSSLHRTREMLQPVVPAVMLGVAVVALAVFGFGSYGLFLFFGAPFAMGSVAGALTRLGGSQSPKSAIGAACLSVVITGGLLLLMGWEGFICLLMAAPPAIVLAAFGAYIAFAVSPRAKNGPVVSIFLVLILPFLIAAESIQQVPPPREVVSSIEIDAPRNVVWQNVTSFSELPPPNRLIFELGIAYPIRARIEGEGVGAVRYCEFSTGPFVEPVTVWDEPSRLAFDVSAQPATMDEWSPYQVVNAPHLLESFRSERGEFRLAELPGGRTKLYGSTVYKIALFPQFYWGPISDALIHSIHLRVLEHVKSLSEAG